MDIAILDEIREKINTADMILLGIGEEMEMRKDAVKADRIFSSFHNEIEALSEAEQEFIKSSLYIEGLKERREIFSESLVLYHRLWELVREKNYFVITVCKDDILYYSDFDRGRIVTPCGTRRQMKCYKGCKECNSVLETGEYFENLNQRLKQMYEQNCFDGDEIRKYIPVCEECGSCMEMNFAGREGYSEEGYEKDWKRYMLWLQGTLNKNLCILELGAGFAYPTVIRWPFEKIAMLNRKAHLVRVNQKLPQTAKEMKEKSFSVEINSRDFIAKITE